MRGCVLKDSDLLALHYFNCASVLFKSEESRATGFVVEGSQLVSVFVKPDVDSTVLCVLC